MKLLINKENKENNKQKKLGIKFQKYKKEINN